jgi:hypothetical protein
MDIIIYLDKFSFHLFHIIELYIVLFFKLKQLNKKCNNIYFLKPNKEYEIHNVNYDHNTLLCSKLFNVSNYIVIDDINVITNTDILIIDRRKLNGKNINKSFAEYIIDFPSNLWSNCFNNNVTNNDKRNNFKILYAVRYNTSRCLDNESHEILCSIVNSYNGTICDMGTLSLEEQINTFKNHNIVIGVHGNNLSGIMWMNPKCHVFEILPLKFKNIVYDFHCMSLCMDHKYTQIDCNPQFNNLNCMYSFNDATLDAINYNFKLLYNLYN